jgi:BON domain-containing protein
MTSRSGWRRNERTVILPPQLFGHWSVKGLGDPGGAGRVAIPEGRRRTCCAAAVGRQRSKQPDLCTTLGHTIGLKKQIESALVRDAQLDAQGITLEIKGAKAILKGSVRSWAERQEAQRVAWQAPGIAEVDNWLIRMSEAACQQLSAPAQQSSL